MGNSLSLKKRTAKIMKIDGTSFRLKPPSQAANALRDHPGFSLLESDEVKRVGLRARPLDPDAPLKPGKLYFLVEIPNVSSRNNPRGPGRAWSGQLNLGAKERLESLMLSRRSVSDVCLAKPSVESKADGSVRLRMRLPKAQVEKLMEESKSASEAAEKIMKLCAAKDRGMASTAVVPDKRLVLPKVSSVPSTAVVPEKRLVLPKVSSVPATPGKKEKRTRFMEVPDEIIML